MEEASFDWNVLNNSINSTLMSFNRQLNQDERPSTSTGKVMISHTDWNEETERDISNNPNPFEIDGGNERESNGLTREIIFKQIKRMKMGKSSKECTICFSKFNKEELIRRLPCKHIFHEGCIIPWLAKNIKCPNCRFNLKEYFSDILDDNNN